MASCWSLDQRVMFGSLYYEVSALSTVVLMHLYFICHMTQQDHSIEMSCIFMGERCHVFQVLHRFKPSSRHVRDSLTLVLAANKAKHFLSTNHTPKTIHHHHHHHQSSSQHVTTLKSLVTIGILIVKSQNTSS